MKPRVIFVLCSWCEGFKATQAICTKCKGEGWIRKLEHAVPLESLEEDDFLVSLGELEEVEDLLK